MRPTLLVPIFLLLSATGSAGTLFVPAGYSTIQSAINAAVNGDEVLVAPGTYVENLDFLGKAITVRSDTDGNPATRDLAPQTTIIDGNQNGTVVAFVSGEGSGSVLEGFTVTNGSGTDDGTTHRGGGIYCLGSSPVITNNLITGNAIVSTVTGGGGGIACVSYSSPLISGNTITWNTVTSTAQVGGAGIACMGNSAPMILDNVVTDNSIISTGGIEGGGGGIMFFDQCSGTIAGTVVARNSSDWSGGIHCQESSMTVEDCLIFGNKATSPAGGIGMGWSQLVVTNTTLVGNSSQVSGGGITCLGNGSTTTATNTVLWNNTAPIGAQVELIDAVTFTVSYSDVQGGKAEVEVGPYAQLLWGVGMINADPLFRDLANDAYDLQGVSPCIDRGDPADSPGGRDAMGNPRFLDGDLDRDLVVDMGACEFDHVALQVTGAATPGGTVTVDLSGTAGLQSWLFASGASSEVLLKPYGALFVDLSTSWMLLPAGAVPNQQQWSIPPALPTPLDVTIQALALDLATRAGNFSNDVVLTIQ